MDVLRKTLIQGIGDTHMSQFTPGGAKPEAVTPTQKPNRNTLLQAVAGYLLKTYRETASSEDKISAEEIHFNVNRSESIAENVSFITASRLVKSTFKNAHYDKDTKMFHGLERVYPSGDLMKERNMTCTQPRWPSSLLSMLAQLYENQMLCDAFIKCKNKAGAITYIPCHSCVLAASSHILLGNLNEKRMILRDCSKVSIECEGINLYEWSTILQFMYKGNVDLCVKNVMRIWTVARFLRIQGLSVMLENMMKDNDIIVSSKLRNQCSDEGQIYIKSYKENPSHLIHTPSFMIDPTPTLPNSQQVIVPQYEPLNYFRTELSNCTSQTPCMPMGLPADSIRSIAEQVISNYGSEQSEVPAENCQSLDELEPKSKKRKMYKPRKVAQNDTNEPSKVIGTIQIANSRDETKHPTLYGNQTRVHETVDEAIDYSESSFASPSKHRDLADLGVKQEHFDGSDYDCHNSSGVYIDTADDAHAYNYPEPVVIAPIADCEISPRSTPDFHIKHEELDFAEQGEGDNANRSMLYGLLNVEKENEADTPMLKSLLSTRATATQSPNLGLTPRFVEKYQTESENELMDLYDAQEATNTNQDPDYQPSVEIDNTSKASHRKKKRKRFNTLVRKPEPVETPPCGTTGREALPHKVQSVFTWSAEDLQRERQKLSKEMDVDFSASSLLLSMITKATPNVETIGSAVNKTSAETVEKSDSQKAQPVEKYTPPETVSGSASQILIGLLGNRNDNLNSNNSATDQTNSSSKSSKVPGLSTTPANSSPNGLLFSQVLQGMASAYSSPIGNKTSSDYTASHLAPILATQNDVIQSPSKSENDVTIKLETIISPGTQTKSQKKAHKSKKKSAKEHDKSKSVDSSGLKIKLTFQKTGDDYSVKAKRDKETVSRTRNAQNEDSLTKKVDTTDKLHKSNESDTVQIKDTTRALVDLVRSHSTSGSLYDAVSDHVDKNTHLSSLLSKQCEEQNNRAHSRASNSCDVDCATDNIADTWSHLQSLLDPSSPAAHSHSSQDHSNHEAYVETSQEANSDSHDVHGTLRVHNELSQNNSDGRRHFERDRSPSDTEARYGLREQKHEPNLNARNSDSPSSSLLQQLIESTSNPSPSGHTVRELLAQKVLSSPEEHDKDQKWEEYLSSIGHRSNNKQRTEQEKDQRWKEYLDGIMKNASLS